MAGIVASEYVRRRTHIPTRNRSFVYAVRRPEPKEVECYQSAARSTTPIRPNISVIPSGAISGKAVSHPSGDDSAVRGVGPVRECGVEPPGLPGGHYQAMKYEATHKKALGGCTGQLELTSTRLHFRCSHETDLDIPVNSIAGAHKDGVVLASGEKYHFVIANHTKDQVEMIFNLWLNRVRPFEPANRASSF
jgi:hypothetical protein